MKSSEWKMILAGGLAWAVGTVYFFFRAAATFQHGTLVYANGALTIVAYVLLFRRMLKWLGIEPRDTGWAALLFVLPGMTGEILALFNSSIFLPGIRSESVVIYAALLFAGYSSIGYYALYRQQSARAARVAGSHTAASHR